MFYVGIDVAKHKHEAVVTDDSGSVIIKSFHFANSFTGYRVLIDKLKKITIIKSQFVFGMESTGHYWLALFTRLKKDGYNVQVFNPIQSDAIRGLYIRQNKCDSRDAFIIAEILRFGKYSATVVPQDKLMALRELCRNRSFLVDEQSDLKRKADALLDQVFPEYEKLFSNNFVHASTELLMKYPTPEKISKASVKTISNIISKASNGYYGLAKAQQIKIAAKDTFGIADTCGAYSSLIALYIHQIKTIDEQIDELNKKIEEIFNGLDSKITTISGIGTTLGATIISEIGDIHRFTSADTLAAYAGIDPTVKQSGNFAATRNHMSKRGSPYLRRAIWHACVVAVQFDPMFKAYYEKKAAEGKRYMVIIGHCTKKMMSVIYAVLRDNKEYNPCM